MSCAISPESEMNKKIKRSFSVRINKELNSTSLKIIIILFKSVFWAIQFDNLESKSIMNCNSLQTQFFPTTYSPVNIPAAMEIESHTEKS